MKLRSIATLTGPALDWAVATALGAKLESRSGGMTWLLNGGMIGYQRSYNPSTDWEQGGPIIEHALIDVHYTEDGWYANMYDRMKDGTPGYAGDTFKCGGEGPTPLIAAMRCYITSQVNNDAMEIPEELL